MTPIEKAEAAYQEAAQVDTADAWRGAATLLFKVRRKPRTNGGKFKGRYPAPVAVVTFADGQEIRMSFWVACHCMSPTVQARPHPLRTARFRPLNGCVVPTSW